MLKDKSLKTVIGMIAFAVVLLVIPQRAAAQSSFSVQLTDRDIAVSEFNAINVSDDFEVTVSRGSYGVRLTVDKELAPYVEVYVRSKVLYISYFEKAVPKDLRKLYKGKTALTPVFRVVATTPELKAVTLSDNASLVGTGEFTASEFELTTTGKSQVKNLSISAASARISMKKNAVASLNLKTDRGVEINTDNNASLKLSFTGRELALTADGSSQVVADSPNPTQALTIATGGSSEVSVSSDTEKLDLTTEGSSKLMLTGKATEMKVTGSRSSVVDAFSMPVETVEANLSNSSTVTVTVSKSVYANLIGGSALFYSGTPEFKIEKIVRSTLAPYGTK